MICHPCRDKRHDECPGDTHCFCQHGVRKTKVRVNPKVVMVGDYTPPAERHTNGNGASSE